MSSRGNPLFLCSLCLIVGSVWSQGSTHDAFIIQYLERRLAQMEVSFCFWLTSRSRFCHILTSFFVILLNKVKSQVDGISMRMDRVERELEYLEDKIPTQSNIEIEEALLEQQIKIQNEVLDVINNIKSLKVVKKAGDVSGSWLKDLSEGSQKVYLFSGIRNNTVLQFPSLQSFKKKTKPQTKLLQLPFHWQGTGHVVHHGFLYYHMADTPNQILKFDLLNSTVVDRTLIPGAGKLPTYSLNPNTYLDLAVDELGLWVIYADPDYGGNLVIIKLDKETLAVKYTWDTQCKSRDAEGAFLVCGTLHVVYNTGYGGRSTIQCLYDIHDTVHSNESPVVFFPKRYSSHSSIHYHPGDKHLYAWDDGYQTIYERLEVMRHL
uniref:Olfactomedin-like domain-containing protein n=1 Tax=Oryzias latipes TaxID=8090 RepID=A0A3B3HMR8_ORYLA